MTPTPSMSAERLKEIEGAHALADMGIATLAYRPAFLSAHYNRGELLAEVKRLQAGMEAVRDALEYVRDNVAMEHHDAVYVEEVIDGTASTASQPSQTDTGVTLPWRDGSTAPEDGSEIIVGVTYRYALYKPDPRCPNRPKGRWQHMGEFGWENCAKPERWLAALTPTPQAQTGWRTIDSAPKDGKCVLVYWPLEYDGPVTVSNEAFRLANPGCWYVSHFDRDAWWVSHLGADGYVRVTPTHWMPLPSPPTPQERE